MSSEWDYLSRVNIGQYLPLASVVHRMDVRMRILLFTFLVVGVTIAHTPVMLAAGALFTLLVLLLSRVPVRYVLRGLLTPLPYILLLAVIQVLFNSTPDPASLLMQIGGWKLSLNDLAIGLMMIVRFACLIVTLGLGSSCIATPELIKGLRALLGPLEKLHFPVRDLVMVVQVTLRFTPFLAIGAERIAKAQAARGAAWGGGRGGIVQRVRQVVPLLVPLFTTSLRKAEMLALAMDARGYRSTGATAVMRGKRIRPLDGLAVAAALALLVLAILF